MLTAGLLHLLMSRERESYGALKLEGHYSEVIMGAMASQITSLTIVYSTVYSGTDQRKHQSSTSLAFVRGIHRWPVNSPHKWPVTQKMFPFDDVNMALLGGRGMFEWCIEDTRTCQHGVYYWEYYPCALSLCQVPAIHLMIGQPRMKSTDDQSSNELQCLDRQLGHQGPSQYKDRLIYVWWFPC